MSDAMPYTTLDELERDRVRARRLCDSTCTTYGWDANPWVWVLSFREARVSTPEAERASPPFSSPPRPAAPNDGGAE